MKRVTSTGLDDDIAIIAIGSASSLSHQLTDEYCSIPLWCMLFCSTDAIADSSRAQRLVLLWVEKVIEYLDSLVERKKRKAARLSLPDWDTLVEMSDAEAAGNTTTTAAAAAAASPPPPHCRALTSTANQHGKKKQSSGPRINPETLATSTTLTPAAEHVTRVPTSTPSTKHPSNINTTTPADDDPRSTYCTGQVAAKRSKKTTSTTATTTFPTRPPPTTMVGNKRKIENSGGSKKGKKKKTVVEKKGKKKGKKEMDRSSSKAYSVKSNSLPLIRLNTDVGGLESSKRRFASDSRELRRVIDQICHLQTKLVELMGRLDGTGSHLTSSIQNIGECVEQLDDEMDTDDDGGDDGDDDDDDDDDDEVEADGHDDHGHDDDDDDDDDDDYDALMKYYESLLTL